MIEHEDDDLRACFHRLRDEDVARSPEFRMLVDAAQSTVSRAAGPFSSRRPIRLLAAAAGIVLALGVGREITRRARAVRAGVVPSITTWRSPTQGLLRTSDRELLAPSPLLSSVLGAAARIPLQRKGE
jgi:hypothetical protein